MDVEDITILRLKMKGIHKNLIEEGFKPSDRLNIYFNLICSELISIGATQDDFEPLVHEMQKLTAHTLKAHKMDGPHAT